MTQIFVVTNKIQKQLYLYKVPMILFDNSYANSTLTDVSS